MAHYLYLIRHGEQQDAGHAEDGPLTSRGRQQAQAIGKRLSGVPFPRAFHSPMERAEETARILTEQLPDVEARPSVLLTDCIPSGPTPGMPDWLEPFFSSVTRAEIEAGEAQMTDALAEFLTPTSEDQHDLLITHNFVIGWFVREVFRGPSWGWLGLNQANCGLTIIRIRKAPALVTFNDLGHLPPELRSGLPEAQPV